MKFFVDIKLCTDGDFYLDKNFKYEDDTMREWADYFICKVFKEETPPHKSWKSESWLRYQVKYFLEETLISLRFNISHYYLMGELFEFFDKAIKAVDSLRISEYYEDFIWGNYEGTNITLICEED